MSGEVAPEPGFHPRSLTVRPLDREPAPFFDLVPTKMDDVLDEPLQMRCVCGGRWLLAFFRDDQGRMLGEVPTLLHTEPACEPFRQLDLRQAYEYLVTGRVPRPRDPIITGPKEAKAKR